MRLTQFSDLAMRVLIYAAQNPEGRFTIDDVNQVHNVSRGHLMKVVNTLTRSGLLIAHRGRNGGLKLARSPESISLAEVLALTEPDFALAECMRDTDDCPLVGRCKLPNVYGNALKAFMQALKSQTLKDVLPAEPA
jgi:Rrf2 family nitric oxide-sensitive transcriptional repressor